AAEKPGGGPSLSTKRPGGSWGKKACQLGEFAICPGAKAGLSRPLISPRRNSAWLNRFSRSERGSLFHQREQPQLHLPCGKANTVRRLVVYSKPLCGASVGFGFLISCHGGIQLGPCDAATSFTCELRQQVPHVGGNLIRGNANPVCVHLA